MSFLESLMAPPPSSPLGRWRLLAPKAGIRVSPLCLGAMNFGTSWKQYMGTCGQKTTEEILDYFYEHGGNFIDTSNNYQGEESEQWIGEWMRKRGNRDELGTGQDELPFAQPDTEPGLVIATKYTMCYKTPQDKKLLANFTGNGTKSMHVSVNDSLKKLQTDYIDLLYVHWWDFSTSIPELMQSLNTLVTSGKVLYLGISDTPAWVVSKANQYARDHGMREFSVYQGMWSAASRDFERDIIPMCRDEGMALAPWGALGGGAFKTEEQRKSDNGRQVKPTEGQIKISQALEAIARRKNSLITSVAMAYVMHKAPYVFPIVGGRTVEHLRGNIEALTLELSDRDIQEIEAAQPFDHGFPMSFNYMGQEGQVHLHPQNVSLLGLAGKFDYVPLTPPIAAPQNGGSH